MSKFRKPSKLDKYYAIHTDTNANANASIFGSYFTDWQRIELYILRIDCEGNRTQST